MIYLRAMISTASGREQKKPGAPLAVNEVRAAFVRRHTSMHAWARRRGYWPAYVDMAVRGRRGGPKARRIVAELKRELGL